MRGVNWLLLACSLLAVSFSVQVRGDTTLTLTPPSFSLQYHIGDNVTDFFEISLKSNSDDAEWSVMAFESNGYKGFSFVPEYGSMFSGSSQCYLRMDPANPPTKEGTYLLYYPFNIGDNEGAVTLEVFLTVYPPRNCSTVANPCNGNGVCSSVTGLCSCYDGYFTGDCSIYCNNATNCTNQGYCTSDGVCSCYGEWRGKSCNVFCDPSTTCSGQGSCSDRGTCDCDSNYFGNNCTYQWCSGYDNGNMCNGHGNCNYTTALCTCEQGFNCEENTNKPAYDFTTCHRCFNRRRIEIYIAVATGAVVTVIVVFIGIYFYRNKRRGYSAIQ